MKKIFCFICLGLFYSCVEDPNDLTADGLFNLMINNQAPAQAQLIANNTTRYTFELSALPGIRIENNKNVTLSVSDGTISSQTNIAAPGVTSLSVPVTAGKVVFYYSAGSKPKNSVLLSATVENVTQTFNLTTHASEPDYLVLSPNIPNPHTTNNVEVTAFLLKNNSNDNFVSEGLQVDFSAAPIDNGPTIPQIMAPPFSTSILNAQSGFVTAKATLSTNQVPGSVKVTAKYTNSNGVDISADIILNFVP